MSNGGQVPVSVGAAFIPGFHELYEAHFDFVWRSARRLGAHPDELDDVVQETFLVVHRQLDTFEGRAKIQTWLFGIVFRIVRSRQRSRTRRGPHEPLDEQLADAKAPSPERQAAQQQAWDFVEAFLLTLDPDKRAVFILSELEGMTAPEIATATEANVNTVYARVRAVRRAFESAVARRRAKEPKA